MKNPFELIAWSKKVEIPIITLEKILNRPVVISENVKVFLAWFDSYGAKSSCIFVETPDTNVLIDPGAVSMQLGFPLEDSEKIYLEE